jgi:hypothetical protein
LKEGISEENFVCQSNANVPENKQRQKVSDFKGSKAVSSATTVSRSWPGSVDSDSGKALVPGT